MKLKKGFELRDVCGEKIVAGEGLGAINFAHLLSLNETATWLWQEAIKQDSFTIDTLTTAMTEEYDVPIDVAREDVEKIVMRWQEIGMIEA